jgi:hypothetical protein
MLRRGGTVRLAAAARRATAAAAFPRSPPHGQNSHRRRGGKDPDDKDVFHSSVSFLRQVLEDSDPPFPPRRISPPAAGKAASPIFILAGRSVGIPQEFRRLSFSRRVLRYGFFGRFYQSVGWMDTDKEGRTRTDWRGSMVFRKTRAGQGLFPSNPPRERIRYASVPVH